MLRIGGSTVMYGWHESGWGPGQWIVMVALVAAFWTAVVVGIVYLVRHLGADRPGPPGPPAQGGDGAEALLRQRFAAGELTEEQFRQALKTLRES